MNKYVNGELVTLTPAEEVQRETDIATTTSEQESSAWIEGRISEYPAIAEQMDNIYHNGIDAWKADIKVIKDKYPKP